MRCSVGRTMIAVVLGLAFRQQHVGALINDQCDLLVEKDCRIANSFCQKNTGSSGPGFCACEKGYRLSRDESACLTEIGKKTCIRDVDCSVSNSECDRNGRCVCRHSYATSRDKTECLPPLGRACLMDHECGDLVANSICTSRTCSCTDNYVPSRNRTVCLPVLGQICNAEKACLVKDSYCDNGVCACLRKTHIPSANKTVCLSVVRRILAPCDEDRQCINEALGRDTMCVNDQCMCRFGYTRANQTCDKRKELDDWCSHNQQCQMIDHSSCVKNKCSCDPYFVPFAANRTACVPIAQLYGSSCVDDVQCTVGFGNGGICEEGACKCQSNYHFVVNKTSRCVPSRGIGEGCNQNECYLPLDKDKQQIACVDHVCACTNGNQPSQDNQTCAGAGSVYASFLVPLALLVLAAFSFKAER